jgi:trans-aconitate methyltransferase
MCDTDKHWEAWGQQDPYFAVLSDKKFRKGADRQEFFGSGLETVDGLVAAAKRHFGNLNYGSALEFGSGVGRLTMPLSKHFGSVVGVEISEAMINEAKVNCVKSGINNIQFFKSDDQLSSVGEKFDFIVSVLVLQHIPNKRGMRIVSRLLEKLNANGVIAIHFPVRIRLPWPERLIYRIKQTVPASRYLFNLLQNRRLTEPLMQMNEYSLTEVIELASARGIQEFALTTCIETKVNSVILFGRT